MSADAHRRRAARAARRARPRHAALLPPLRDVDTIEDARAVAAAGARRPLRRGAARRSRAVAERSRHERVAAPPRTRRAARRRALRPPAGHRGQHARRRPAPQGRVRRADGRARGAAARALARRRWTRPTPRCSRASTAPVLDIGCGPGPPRRRAARRRARAASASTSRPSPCEITRGRGARRDARLGVRRTSPAPATGAPRCCWTATSASAARPAALLRRARELLAPGGAVARRARPARRAGAAHARAARGARRGQRVVPVGARRRRRHRGASPRGAGLAVDAGPRRSGARWFAGLRPAMNAAARARSAPAFWRSPLRGPWLTAALGSVLLVLVAIVAAHRLPLARRLPAGPARQRDRRPAAPTCR